MSVLVLMVGILGVAGMQWVSFQTNQSAYARSQAVYLAQDMINRMRANPGGYQSTTVYDAIDTSNPNATPSDPGCVTAVSGCTPLQMAQQDVREWTSNFRNVANIPDFRPTLPNGVGMVARSATSDFTVTVSWDERGWDNRERLIQNRQVTITVTL